MISKSLLGVGAAALLCTAAPSQAATVLDPAGDFLPSFAGPNDADLDVCRGIALCDIFPELALLGRIVADGEGNANHNRTLSLFLSCA